MNIKIDPETGVLYLRLKGLDGVAGLVEETKEVEEGVYLDLDAEGKPVGMEFLSMEDFEAFLRKYPEGIEIFGLAGTRSKPSIDQAFYRIVSENWPT